MEIRIRFTLDFNQMLDVMNYGALTVIAILLCEDTKLLFDDDDDDDEALSNMQPWQFCDPVVNFFQTVNLTDIFDGDASYKIFIENYFITEVEYFVRSIAVLVTFHYMSNVAYSTKLNSFYIFLQRNVIEIDDISN